MHSSVAEPAARRPARIYSRPRLALWPQRNGAAAVPHDGTVLIAIRRAKSLEIDDSHVPKASEMLEEIQSTLDAVQH